MKASIIIAVYKDLEALKCIIKALEKQTYFDFEVIIAEDNDVQEIKNYIGSITTLKVKHTYQPDKGIQKARSLNNGILASNGEYLIFIDGDCIPYTTFIESHIALSEKGKVLIGRRVNLGETVSQKIRDGILKSDQIEKNYFKYYRILQKDAGTHLEQGFWFHPKNFIYKLFFENRKKNHIGLLGCNYSCFRDDLIAIDGYDESYGETALADDTDLQWRFEMYGLSMKSCKMAANVFHLYHSRSHRNIDDTAGQKLLKQRQSERKYYAMRGLSTH